MSKVTTLADAVESHVDDGSSVYIAGFTHLIGFAAGHEIIRQGRRDLRLVRMTPDVVYDQLVAAGCARELVFSYIGNPGLGSLHCIRRAMERGALAWEEYTHGSLIAALRAGASGLPFALVPAVGGTDLERVNPSIRAIASPFDGRPVSVVAALRPDVAFVHVQRCDAEGNAQVWGGAGDLREAAFAARRVVVTAEEVVDEQVIRSDPGRTLLPGFVVDAVVHEPWGAHPSFVQGCYARDNRFYREWVALSRDGRRLRAYLDRWVHGSADRAAYARRLAPRLAELRQVGQGPSDVVNYGSNKATAAVQD